MQKPIFATLGIVVAAFAVMNDLSHAQVTVSAPATTSGAAASPAVSPAAGSAALAAPTFVPIGATGGGVSQQGMGTAIGPGAPAIGSGLGIGGGAPMGGGLPIGGGAPIAGGTPIGSGAGIAGGTPISGGQALSAGQPVANALPIATGNTTAGSGLRLQGTIAQSGSAFQSVGNLAANPNMQIISNAAGQFFFRAPNGQLQTIPAGTNIAALMGQSSMGLTTLQRAALFNGTAAPFMSTPMTLMRTTSDGSIATASANRGVFTNGFPTAVAGNVITEYPSQRVESFARVYPKAPAAKPAHKRSRKHSGVYLK